MLGLRAVVAKRAQMAPVCSVMMSCVCVNGFLT